MQWGDNPIQKQIFLLDASDFVRLPSRGDVFRINSPMHYIHAVTCKGDQKFTYCCEAVRLKQTYTLRVVEDSQAIFDGSNIVYCEVDEDEDE